MKKSVRDALTTRYRSEKRDSKAKGKSRSKSRNDKKTLDVFTAMRKGI